MCSASLTPVTALSITAWFHHHLLWPARRTRAGPPGRNGADPRIAEQGQCRQLATLSLADLAGE